MRRTSLAMFALMFAVMPPGLAACNVAESDTAAAEAPTYSNVMHATPTPAELPEVSEPAAHVRALDVAIPGQVRVLDVVTTDAFPHNTIATDAAPEVASASDPPAASTRTVTMTGRFAGDDTGAQLGYRYACERSTHTTTLTPSKREPTRSASRLRPTTRAEV